MRKISKFYALLVLSLIVPACSFFDKSAAVEPVGNFFIANFNSVTLNAPGVMEITQGEIESLEILGDKTLTSAVRAEVVDGGLVISTLFDIPPGALIAYKLRVKNINSITLDSFSVIKIPALKGNQLEMVINGLGRIQLGEVEAQNLKVNINGDGNLSADLIKSGTVFISSNGAGNVSVASGSADILKLNFISGSFFGEDFKSRSADVTVSGAAFIFVWAAEKMNAVVDGAGRVTYFGEPVMSMRMSGGGQIVGGGSK